MKKAVLLSFVFLLLGSYSFAAMPVCMDKDRRLDFNEDQVINWIHSTKPKFLARALVRGLLVNVLEDRQNHVHFEIDLDKDLKTTHDRVEVIYNRKFGALPSFSFADEVIVCGDYITDPYSPVGAIIHWVHVAPRKGHDHGFLIINSRKIGQIDPKDR